MTTEQRLMPIQHAKPLDRKPAVVPECVYMAAYEVYCHVHSPQPAMIEGWCRGGFGISELTGFLYARSFPKAEWRQRLAGEQKVSGEEAQPKPPKRHLCRWHIERLQHQQDHGHDE